jgi:hypothetical protein
VTDDYAPTRDDVEDRATERQHDRAERVERILEAFEAGLEDRSYPVSSAELGAEYADQPIDLPNETGTVGDVFDRLDEEFDSAAEAREALYGELAGEATGGGEDNPERPVEELAGEDPDRA